ncbi:MAG: IS110 family transposase [Acidimicrobiia bacterium]|nr:IS110 family transposase [Acidimicrobiia bacterium]
MAQRIGALTDEIRDLDCELERLVKIAAPTMITKLGIGPGHAATLLTAAGENIDRLRSEAAFAHLCGVAPVPASSGKTSRHRLNVHGNRQANRSLHMIVIVRLRYCDRTRAYMARRTAEGRTKKEVIRCLKRYIVRDMHRTLRADLATLETRLDAL